MRVDRVVFEAGEHTFTLDLHPRLTVVAGMGTVERAALVGELIGALGGSRPGVHVELAGRSGGHLAIFRPTVGTTRVIDVDRSIDLTDKVSGPDGRCDLLGRFGLDAAGARRLMRLTAADLTVSTDQPGALATLAHADQGAVWEAAEALDRAEDALAARADALGSAPEDAAVIEEVERRHQAVERAADRLEATRRRTFRIGGAAAIATLPAVVVGGPAGLGLLAVSTVAVLASLHARRRLDAAADAEQRALAEIGATSYLGFQLRRVDDLLGDEGRRRDLLDAADLHRRAQAAWSAVAGDVPVEWAIDHRDEIRAAARRAGSDRPAIRGRDLTADITQVLVNRLAQARDAAGEGLPLILDEPFEDVEDTAKPLLLELLSRSAGDPQIIFLTDDEHVASWARIESLTGDVAVVEPAPSSS